MPQDPLHLLCIEPRFPGRLGGVADWLVRHRGYRCHFYCHSAAPREFWPRSIGKGLEVVAFNVGGVARESSVAWQRSLERSLCYSFGAWEVLEGRRPRPVDAVLGRSDGLGSSLFAPVHVPRTPIVQFFDYYFHAREHDLADEAGPETPPAYYHWRRAANAIDLLDLENGVTPWTPTTWQRNLYPQEYRDDFLVLHDGIDARTFAPPNSRVRLVNGRTIPEGMKVITFIARSLDRLRGFDRFLRLANALCRERSDVVAIALGSFGVDRTLDVAYHGRDYRAQLIQANPPPDPDRLWLLGTVPPPVVAEVLACSDLHVYPSRTYPFSRSTFQAMATGRAILASDNLPNREVIQPNVNGLLITPDDPDSWVRLANQVLDDPGAHAPLGRAAREVVLERFDRETTLPRLAERLNQLAGPGG
ncbi:glycosyltransferase [Tundrisphaera lichenicola]|uniref:glycosyltransferase n=1 Tax=Tundrisphaera lichenicola TaxID=2029860 RepID=UPI003EBB2305